MPIASSSSDLGEIGLDRRDERRGKVNNAYKVFTPRGTGPLRAIQSDWIALGVRERRADLYRRGAIYDGDFHARELDRALLN